MIIPLGQLHNLGMFLPKTTTSLLQPLNQGIIRAFKVYYARHTFHGILGVSVMQIF
jgi:DDE superfamily endonuclease.